MMDIQESIKERICQGDLISLTHLLKMGEVDMQLGDGWTPLMHACRNGRDSIVNYLLANGANPNWHFELFTPIMAVCNSTSTQSKLVNCAKYLIEYGADLNAMDKYKNTALMYACRAGHDEVISVLLNAECNVNLVDNDGITALHLACLYNHPETARLLLKNGALKTIKDRRGRLPLDLATSKGLDEIIQILDEQEHNDQIITCLTYKRKKSPFEELLEQLPGSNNASIEDGFHPDVEILLSGMRLDQLKHVFLGKNLSLSKFVNIKNDELLDLGIRFTSWRERIITDNKRFVVHPWGEGSLPRSKDIVQMIDIVRSLATFVKHIHILWITSLYCHERSEFNADKNLEKIHDLYAVVSHAYRQSKVLIKELAQVQKCVEHLDRVENITPADLILPMKPSKQVSTPKVLFYTVACAFVLWKGSKMIAWM